MQKHCLLFFFCLSINTLSAMDEQRLQNKLTPAQIQYLAQQPPPPISFYLPDYTREFALQKLQNNEYEGLLLFQQHQRLHLAKVIQARNESLQSQPTSPHFFMPNIPEKNDEVSPPPIPTFTLPPAAPLIMAQKKKFQQAMRPPLPQAQPIESTMSDLPERQSPEPNAIQKFLLVQKQLFLLQRVDEKNLPEDAYFVFHCPDYLNKFKFPFIKYIFKKFKKHQQNKHANQSDNAIIKKNIQQAKRRIQYSLTCPMESCNKTFTATRKYTLQRILPNHLSKKHQLKVDESLKKWIYNYIKDYFESKLIDNPELKKSELAHIPKILSCSSQSQQLSRSFARSNTTEKRGNTLYTTTSIEPVAAPAGPIIKRTQKIKRRLSQKPPVTNTSSPSKKQRFNQNSSYPSENAFANDEMLPTPQPLPVIQKNLLKQKLSTTRRKYTKNPPHTLYYYTCPQCNKKFKGKDKGTLRRNMTNCHFKKQHLKQKFDIQHFELNVEYPKKQHFNTTEKKNSASCAVAPSQVASSSNSAIKKSIQEANQSDIFQNLPTLPAFSFSHTEFFDQNFVPPNLFSIQTDFAVLTPPCDDPINFTVDCPYCTAANVFPTLMFSGKNNFNTNFPQHMIDQHTVLIIDAERYINENFIQFSAYCTKCSAGISSIADIKKLYEHKCPSKENV